MDKALLFAARLPEDDVEIPGIGTVRVRALNRLEAVHVQEAKGAVQTELRIMTLGLVDPQLTEDEVREWMKAAPAGEIEPVSHRIAALSGMIEGAEKEAYKSLPD